MKVEVINKEPEVVLTLSRAEADALYELMSTIDAPRDDTFIVNGSKIDWIVFNALYEISESFK